MSGTSTAPANAAPPSSGMLSEIGHGVLDLIGLVPVFGEPADVANAAWHAAEGNYVDAGLSLISVIPVVGDAIGKGGKLAKRFGGKLSGKALDVVKTLDFPGMLGKFKNHPSLGPHVTKIVNALESWRKNLLKGFSDCTGIGKPAACPQLLARKKQAAELLEKATKAEKRVTPDLENLAQQNGMKMEGLDYRLKTEESLARKLDDTAPEQIGDALRYTMVSKPADLAGNAQKTLSKLESEGYQVMKVKDTFKPGAPYKGVNTQIRSPDGQVFELQFHTPQSFDVKQNATHKLYEEFRVLKDGDPKKAQLMDELVCISNRVDTPPGLGDALKGFPRK